VRARQLKKEQEERKNEPVVEKITEDELLNTNLAIRTKCLIRFMSEKCSRSYKSQVRVKGRKRNEFLRSKILMFLVPNVVSVFVPE
jgi:hypothetical protein